MSLPRLRPVYLIGKFVGTTLIVAPPNDAATVHQAIDGAKADGQGGFTVPCNTNASVALTFGGKIFAIDPRDIAVQPVSAADPTGDCVSGIAAGAVGADTEWLVRNVDSTPRHSLTLLIAPPFIGWGCFPQECILLHGRSEEHVKFSKTCIMCSHHISSVV